MPTEEGIVRWGILGTARIAVKLASAIAKAPSAKVVAVASRTLERAEQWSSEIGLHDSVIKYGSYMEMLRDTNVDVVYVPLPTSMHKEWVAKCAKAGKHVLCEKPVGLNAGEVEEMVAVCKEHNVQFMDGVMYMHHVRLNKMKSVLQDKDIMGELVRVTSSFSFCGSTEFLESDIRVKKDHDALGCVGDLGWYQARAMLWAFDTDPVEVVGVSHRTNAEGVVISASAIVSFPNNRLGVMDCGFDTNIRQTMEVAGSKASLRTDDFVLCSSNSNSTFYIRSQAFQAVDPPVVSETAHEGGGCCQEAEMVEKLSGIVRAGALQADWPLITLRTQRLVDAIMASIANGSRPTPVASGS